MYVTSDGSVGLRPEILIDGEIVPRLSDHLQEMKVMSSVQGHAVAAARFLNWGSIASRQEPTFLFCDQEFLDFGRKIVFQVKHNNSPVVLFSGHITSIGVHLEDSSFPEIILTAEDRLEEFWRTVRNRVFEDMTDQDMLETIASDHGLTTQIGLNGPSYERVVQLNQSDFAFCFERVRAAGGELWIENNTLHAVPRAERMSGPIELVVGQNLIQFDARADLQGQATQLRVTGWDVGMKQRITRVADDTALANQTVPGGQTAAGILREISGVHTLVHDVKSLPHQSDQAYRLAEQLYREKAGQFVRAMGKTSATPELRVGTIVTVSEVGPFFEGEYYLTAVTHIFSIAIGFQTEFEAERSWVKRKPTRRSKKEETRGTSTQKTPTLPRKPTAPRSRITRRPVVRRVSRTRQRRQRS